jgi:hypothetical protein
VEDILNFVRQPPMPNELLVDLLEVLNNEGKVDQLDERDDEVCSLAKRASTKGLPLECLWKVGIDKGDHSIPH